MIVLEGLGNIGEGTDARISLALQCSLAVPRGNRRRAWFRARATWPTACVHSVASASPWPPRDAEPPAQRRPPGRPPGSASACLPPSGPSRLNCTRKAPVPPFSSLSSSQKLTSPTFQLPVLVDRCAGLVGQGRRPVQRDAVAHGGRRGGVRHRPR